MKFILAFALSISLDNLNAQTCGSHALMKKGTQLEYMAYSGGYRNDQALRMVFEVGNVTDSAGSTYSTILKKGFGIKDEQNDHYEKTIRLQCDGKNLLIPFDFYNTDTTWFNDGTQTIIKRHLFYTGNAPMNPAVNLVFPLGLEGVTNLPISAKEIKQTTTRTGEPGKDGGWKKLKGETGIWYKEYELSATIRSFKVEGREKVTTPAGTFDCYVIVLDLDFQFNGMPLVTKYSIRYNTEIGVVKMELDLLNGKKKMSHSGSIELTSIKK